MISSIRIQGYRCFDDFTMSGLGRVNLLVGKNNSGKTSALEAILLLVTQGNPRILIETLERRGEYLGDENQEYLVVHAFQGHDMKVGSRISLSSNGGNSKSHVSFSLIESSDVKFHIEGPSSPMDIPFGPSLGLQRRASFHFRHANNAVFVAANSLTVDQLILHWDAVTLTPDEEFVLRSLRFIDPDVERLAAQRSHGRMPERGGFIVKRRSEEQPVTIGSLGEGFWRILALSVALSQCKGSYLLVDEIDSGLHYSVMENMWRMVFQAANEFDIQVFATTHSQDCVHSLAAICGDQPREKEEVTIQRIVRRKVAVSYTEAEIKVAAERNGEVP